MQLTLVNPRKRGGKKKRARRSKRARSGRVARVARRSTRRSARRSVARVARRSTRRSARRRNPISVSGLKGMLMPAVWGGAGAVATDIAFRLLPVPGALSILKGTLAPVTRVGVALGVAKLGSMFLGAEKGRDMLTGSLAVIAYDLLNTYALRFLPVVGAPAAAPAGTSGYELSGYELSGSLGYNSPGQVVGGSGMGEYVSGMAEYVS